MLDLIKFTKLLLVIGGIAWGIYGAFGINIVKRILPDSNAQKIVYILVGVSAVILLFNRNFHLPFLGKTALPSSLLSKDKTVTEEGTFTVKVQVEPNVRVIYWASEPSSEIVPVSTAYGEFKNSGIVTADKDGIANLILKKPSSYTVKKGLFNKKLKPHIHYRYTLSSGMLSEIKTKYVTKIDFLENDIPCDSESDSDSKHKFKLHNIFKSKKSSESDSSHKHQHKLRHSPKSKHEHKLKHSSDSDSSHKHQHKLKHSSDSDSSHKHQHKLKHSSDSDSSHKHKLRHSPKSDLTHVKKCKCPHRHSNIHEHTCKKQFSNSIIIPSMNIENVTINDFSSPTRLDNYHLESNKYLFDSNNEVNRSLNVILQDREISSNLHSDKFPQMHYEDINGRKLN
jgi:uncharacterized membrane protein YuzA (DUF378 family)